MGFLPKIVVKNRRTNNQKRTMQLLPMANKNIMMMTTTTSIKSDTRFLGLPKNKTGLFAADTIHEVKSTRNHLVTVPPLSPQFRHNGSTNLLLASSEQNHHQLQQYRLSKNEIQQYYPIDKYHGSLIDATNYSSLTLNGIRNGFRPSMIRHQKLCLSTASTQRNKNDYETKDLLPKSTFIQSHASVKLRSEIDHIHNKLTRHNKEWSKSLRLQNIRDLNDTPQSTLSCLTSNRDSSPSTVLTADRIHQRFSSAITNITTNVRPTIPAINVTSDQTTQILPGITAPSPSPSLPTNETDNNQQDTIDCRPTHAYQIPQQSNVGNESIFLIDPPPISSITTRSARYDRRYKDSKTVSCPFYVMYFTNLAMQQRQNIDNNTNGKDNNTNNNKETDRTTFPMSSKVRKVPVNSRTSTANPKRQLTGRQVNSPISISTYSTIDDDHTTNSTSIAYNKRLSTKISTGESDNSHMLGDILRTSSWNHVQV